MKRRLVLAVILFAFGAFTSFGQKTAGSKKFTLPGGVNSTDYENGIVLAKLKPAHRALSVSSGAGGSRVASIPGAVLKPLVNQNVVKQNNSSRAPRAGSESGLDMTLYVKMYVGTEKDIETRINELYATGYFDIIEPNYAARMDLVPNDPGASNQQQSYLSVMQAYQAWDISKGDAGTVIAIVDSGTDLNHPDLIGNLYTNPGESGPLANNGIDDDLDGWIDNTRGWDFVGNDTLNVFNSNFIGDNNPQLMQAVNAGNLGHGVWVGGCASASTNNGIGVAGIGYNTKLLFTKHTADNQRITTLSIYSGYAGILYAAETLSQDGIPRKIINTSWSGTVRSQISQDIITYVSIDLGCLIVAAAGNNNSTTPTYPSAYDYVLSVAGTSSTDAKANFSSFGSFVDVSAPGVGIFSTQYNDVYGSIQGTSFSSPLTAGAAALVWSKNPTFTSLQVGEQLRITADNINGINPAYADLLGKGRININKALTQTSTSIRASKFKLLNAQGLSADLGSEAYLTMDFTNYLSPSTAALTVTATNTGGLVTFNNNTLSLGVINQGTTIRNSFNPIKLVLNAGIPENTPIQIKLTFTDGTYSDFQYIDLFVNPSFITVDDNQVTTSIASKGRIGYDSPNTGTLGVGFVFNDNPILFEMGVMMGNSSANIVNNVRGVSGIFDQDFSRVDPIKEIVPGSRSSSEVNGSFTSNLLANVLISYKCLVTRETPNDKFVIMEYTVKNNSSTLIPNFRFGLFADWDISTGGATDAAGWDSGRKLGYVYPKQSTSLPSAGIQVLNSAAMYYAIDNDQTIPANPFGTYDGYTDTEKFISLSTSRLAAGTKPDGDDVSHVVSGGPVTIAAGSQVVFAFALHAANNLSELQASADAADILYNQIFNIAKPVVSLTEACYGASATINATGPTNFKWYRSFTGGSPVFTGNQLTTGVLYRDTTLYVSNADNPYESLRAPALVKVKADPTISSSASPQLCPGKATTLSVATADSYNWSTGAVTQSISVNSAGDYSVTVHYNALNCNSSSLPFPVTVLTGPTAAFTVSGSLATGSNLSFTNQSTNAVTSFWNFDDGSTSQAQNPTHQYSLGKNYAVILTVTSANQCQATASKSLDVVTGLEIPIDQLELFPNPASSHLSVKLPAGMEGATFALMTMQGQIMGVSGTSTEGDGSQRIFVGDLAEGLYIFRINLGGEMLYRKVVVRH